MTSVRRISTWGTFLVVLAVAASLSLTSGAGSTDQQRSPLASPGFDHPAGDAPLIAGSVTPTAPAIDRGQSVTLQANPSGGTPSYSYHWFSGGYSACGLDPVIGGATGQTYTASPTVNTYYCYNVTDSYAPPEIATSGTIIVLVNSALVAGAISPATALVDQGNSVTLTANPSDGTPAYVYQWFSGTSPNNCSNDTTPVGTDSATYAASPSTDMTYCYQVTDSSMGTPAVSPDSSVDPVTVGPALVVGAVTPGVPTIDNGQSVTLTAHASGGAPPYKYQWYEGPSATCSSDTTAVGTNSTTYVASPSASEFFCYAVTDASTASPLTWSATDAVTVNSMLVAGAVSPSSPGIDSGQSATLTANPTGGTPSYTYQWFSGSFSTCSGDTAASGATQSSDTVSPTSSTFYCYSVADSSSTPETATSATVLLSVNTPLVAGAVSPVSPIIDKGSTVPLTANPSEGTSPYHFQWYAGTSTTCSDDTTPVGTNSATYDASPSTNTSYCYQVTDSSVGTPSTSLLSTVDQVTVNPALVAGSVTPAVPGIDSGQSVTLLAHPSGGTPIATVQWYAGLSVGCSFDTRVLAETGLSYEVTPTTKTYYCYAVTDGSSDPPTVFSTTDLVTVNSALTAGAVTPGSPTVSSGKAITLTANPSGGTTPYGFQWYGGSSPTCSADPAIAGATGATFTPSPTSDTYYCYKITDGSMGTPAASQLSPADHVVVAPVFSFLGLAGSAAYALLGGIAAAVVVAVVASFLYLRRRKKRGQRISQLM